MQIKPFGDESALWAFLGGGCLDETLFVPSKCHHRASLNVIVLLTRLAKEGCRAAHLLTTDGWHRQRVARSRMGEKVTT
jgi:hypothetical protein